MVLRSIVYLVVFIATTTSSQQQNQAQCSSSQSQINSMKPSFGGINGFYGIAKCMSDGLQGTPTSETYRDLNKLISGNEAGQVAKDMFFSQMGAVLFWSIGFVLVLAAIVLGITTCIWNCCSTCAPKETTVRSEITGYVYAFLLFTVFTFTLTGVILFNVAESNLIDSVDNGMVYTNQLSGDLNNLISNGAEQINCEVKETTTQAFTKMNSLIGGYSANVVKGTQDQVGITAVNGFDDQQYKTINEATEKAGTDLAQSLGTFTPTDPTCISNIATLGKVMGQLRVLFRFQELTKAATKIKTSKELLEINQQIDTIQAEVQTQATKASDAITKSQSQIDQSIAAITNMLTSVQKDINNVMNSLKAAHRDFVGSSMYSSLTIGVRLAVTIPACIGCCFCILGFVAVLLSLKKQDGLALKLSSTVLSAFYSTITSSITLLIFASLAFVLGFFTSAICVPIFDDENYTLFRHMNQTIDPIDGNGPPNVINIGAMLHSCNDEQMAIYTAINGSSVISADSINKKINLNTYRDQADEQITKQAPLNFPLEPQLQKAVIELDRNTREAKQADLSSCGNADVNGKYQAYIQSLEQSNTMSARFYGNLQKWSDNAPKTATFAKEHNDNFFNQGNATITSSISKLMTSLETKVFKCRPLVDIYNNGGFVMCERFGKPIQGLWAAIGLCGMSMFFFAILLLLTFRWLKTHSKETAESAKDNMKGIDGSGSKKLGDRKKSKSSEEHSSPPPSVKTP